VQNRTLRPILLAHLASDDACKYSTYVLPLTCAFRMHVHTQAAYADKIVDGWETVAEETSGYVGVRGSDSMTS
jgi:hypothetical protein